MFARDHFAVGAEIHESAKARALAQTGRSTRAEGRINRRVSNRRRKKSHGRVNLNATVFAEHFQNGFGVGASRFSLGTLPPDPLDRLGCGQVFNTCQNCLAGGTPSDMGGHSVMVPLSRLCLQIRQYFWNSCSKSTAILERASPRASW